MEKSKDLFLQMRESELSTMYSHDFTKKDAIKQGKELVNTILENGNVEPLKVWSNIVRLKEVINSVDAEFRSKLDVIEKESINGVEFSSVNGGETLNYKDDEIYLDIFNELKAREELLKLAYKSKNEIYDEAGVLVPKVSSSPRKSSITVRF